VQHKVGTPQQTKSTPTTPVDIYAYQKPCEFWMPKVSAAANASYELCMTGSHRQHVHVLALGNIEWTPFSSRSWKNCRDGCGVKPTGGMLRTPVAKNMRSDNRSVLSPAESEQTVVVVGTHGYTHTHTHTRKLTLA